MATTLDHPSRDRYATARGDGRSFMMTSRVDRSCLDGPSWWRRSTSRPSGVAVEGGRALATKEAIRLKASKAWMKGSRWMALCSLRRSTPTNAIDPGPCHEGQGNDEVLKSRRVGGFATGCLRPGLLPFGTPRRRPPRRVRFRCVTALSGVDLGTRASNHV